MESYTKYEKARILGARALQLSMNAPILLNISKEKLEELSYDPLKIAEIEFESGILPITIKRPFPKKEQKEEEEEEAEEIETEIQEEAAPAPEEKKEEKETRVKDMKKDMETEVEEDEPEEEEVAEVEV